MKQGRSRLRTFFDLQLQCRTRRPLATRRQRRHRRLRHSPQREAEFLPPSLQQHETKQTTAVLFAFFSFPGKPATKEKKGERGSTHLFAPVNYCESEAHGRPCSKAGKGIDSPQIPPSLYPPSDGDNGVIVEAPTAMNFLVASNGGGCRRVDSAEPSDRR